MILAVTSTSGIGFTTTNKRKSKIRSTILILSHLDVQNHSRLSKKKTPLQKKEVDECFSSKFRKKIEDTNDSVYTSKAINDKSKSLTVQIKTQTSPTVAIPYLGLSMGTLELFLDLKRSKISCFLFLLWLFRKTFHVTVISLHHKKITVTSYKYIVLKKNKNNDISNISANRRGSQRAWLSTDSPASQDGFFELLFFLIIS